MIYSSVVFIIRCRYHSQQYEEYHDSQEAAEQSGPYELGSGFESEELEEFKTELKAGSAETKETQGARIDPKPESNSETVEISVSDFILYYGVVPTGKIRGVHRSLTCLDKGALDLFLARDYN